MAFWFFEGGCFVFRNIALNIQSNIFQELVKKAKMPIEIFGVG
jgi:hypothetical protein